MYTCVWMAILFVPLVGSRLPGSDAFYGSFVRAVEVLGNVTARRDPAAVFSEDEVGRGADPVTPHPRISGTYHAPTITPCPPSCPPLRQSCSIRSCLPCDGSVGVR
jgi:hypothetical protein